MGCRYLVTGVQLGELIALCKLDPEKTNKKLNLIIEEQLVWESTQSLDEDIEKLKTIFEGVV